jgi:hypothetical protein
MVMPPKKACVIRTRRVLLAGPLTAAPLSL